MFYITQEDSDYLLQEDGSSKLIYENPFTIDDVGWLKSFLFQSIIITEALNIIRRLSPANWYWYINANNELLFYLKPTEATHTFIFGKHFKKIEVFKNMEQIKNSYLFRGGDNSQYIYKNYKDDDSISSYERRMELKTDGRVTNQLTADTWADAFLEENKDPIIRTTIEIPDNNYNEVNGYDIESIEPGDTCKFINLNTITSKTFTDNMTITKINYTPEMATLEIESTNINVALQFYILQKRLEEQQASDIPPFYIE